MSIIARRRHQVLPVGDRFFVVPGFHVGLVESNCENGIY
ncbi:Unknown protein sequence [Pseudomonas amygdali pv. lachrymans]|nr:Unknown protein sequence [Pseudomonas amygdali pv. lachrymans]